MKKNAHRHLAVGGMKDNLETMLKTYSPLRWWVFRVIKVMQSSADDFSAAAVGLHPAAYVPYLLMR